MIFYAKYAIYGVSESMIYFRKYVLKKYSSNLNDFITTGTNTLVNTLSLNVGAFNRQKYNNSELVLTSSEGWAMKIIILKGNRSSHLAERICAKEYGKSVQWARGFLRHSKEAMKSYRGRVAKGDPVNC